MTSIEDYIEKLKTKREEVTDKAMGTDLDSELEDLIKLDNVDDELYQMLLLLFTRSKNKLSNIKNENAKNTIMLIDMQIATLEHIIHNRHLNHPNRVNGYTVPVSHNDTPDIDINIVNSNNNNNASNQPASTNNNATTNTNDQFNWAMVFKANNIFMIGLVLICMLLIVWSMFIINPKASADTVSGISTVVEKVNGKDK